MHYRREIDGLRAVAVLAVIFSHAGVSAFSGGFIGVDVFFVISGFLITNIILAEKAKQSFSLLSFYERRARRILPALFLVMLVCMPWAWRFMLPDDFENFGQSIVASVFFSNNILLWLTSGYFALESEFKPLVHTWSLGVEEQFYIIYPLLLLALLASVKRYAVFVLAAISAMSFGWIYYRSGVGTESSFYLLQTRAWELGTGVISAFITHRLAKDPQWRFDYPAICSSLSLLGLSLIAYGVVFFEKTTPAPSAFILVPVLGAALLLVFGTDSGAVGRLLANRVMVGIGLISYSAYLWHQPILAFTRILSLQEPQPPTLVLLALLALPLGYITWRYVERPFRNHKTVSRSYFLGLSLMAGGFLASIGFWIHANSGFVHRWPELNEGIEAAGRHLNAAYNEIPFVYRYRAFDASSTKKIFVIGNSFARDFINAGLENGYFKEGGLSYSDKAPQCLRSEHDVDLESRKLIANADYLIFGSPAVSEACWQSDFAVYRKIGAKKIVVIGTKNYGWNMNSILQLDASQRGSYRAKILDAVWEENRRLSEFLPTDVFVNVIAMIADSNHRVAVFTSEQKIISQDTKHLTKAGARQFGKIVFEHPLLKEIR